MIITSEDSSVVGKAWIVRIGETTHGETICNWEGTSRHFKQKALLLSGEHTGL